MKRKEPAPKRALSLLLALLLLLSGSALAAEPESVTVTGTYGQTEARTILKMVNQYRASSEDAWYWNSDNTTKTYCKSLKPLVYDYALEKIAMQRAAELSVRYGHVRPNGETCYSLFPDGQYTARAENIAQKYDTAANVMGLDPAFSYTQSDYTDYGWMETNEPYERQGHRRNILSDKLTAIGVAHMEVNGVHYWVQEFGAPASGAAATSPNNSLTSVRVELSGSGAAEPDQRPELLLPDVFGTVNRKRQVLKQPIPSGYRLTLKSSNPKKVSVNNKGRIVVAANFVGVVTVTASGTMNGVKAKPAKFKVTIRPESPPLYYVQAAKNRKVTAKWRQNKAVNGYQVQFSRDWDFKAIVAQKRYTSNKKLSFTTKALKKGQYYARVRSYKKIGKTNVWSLWRNRSFTVK